MTPKQLKRFCELVGQGHAIIVAAQISINEHPSEGEIEPPSEDAIALIDEAIRRAREGSETPSKHYHIAEFTGRSTASLLAKINPAAKPHQNCIEAVNHLKFALKEARSAMTAIAEFACGVPASENEIFGFIIDDLAPEIEALADQRERLSKLLDSHAAWAGLNPEEKQRRFLS